MAGRAAKIVSSGRDGDFIQVTQDFWEQASGRPVTTGEAAEIVHSMTELCSYAAALVAKYPQPDTRELGRETGSDDRAPKPGPQIKEAE